MNNTVLAPKAFVSSAAEPIDATSGFARTFITALALAAALGGLGWLLVVLLMQSLG
jgi:hypothetical protein